MPVCAGLPPAAAGARRLQGALKPGAAAMNARASAHEAPVVRHLHQLDEARSRSQSR